MAANLLGQKFEPCRPNETWVTDITYVPTGEGWLYLAGIKDLHTCEVVGYAMGTRMTTDLVNRALVKAVGAKRPGPGLIHHSDRGSQYCAQDYQGLLREFGKHASMSRRGNCYDNAPMESFCGAHSRTNWCTTGATTHAPRPSARSPSTSKSSTTTSGGIRGSGISFRRRLSSNGPVSSRRHEAVTHGVHY